MSVKLTVGRHTLAITAFSLLCASALSACGGQASTSYLPTDHMTGVKTSGSMVKRSIALGSTSLFSDSFSSGTSNWTADSGKWAACAYPGSNSAAYCASDASQNASLAGTSSWTDYSVTTKLQLQNMSGDRRGADVVARAQDGQHFYELELATEASGPQWAIWKDDNNNWSRLTGGPLNVAAGKDYWLQFTVVGSKLAAGFSTDGTSFAQLGSTDDPRFTTGKIGLRTWGGATAAFTNVDVVAAGSAAPAPTSSGLGSVLFSDSFASATSNWTVVNGTWGLCTPTTATAPAYCATGNDQNLSYAGNLAWSDITVSSTLTAQNLNGPRRGVDVMGRYVDQQHFYELELAQEAAGPQWAIWKNDGGAWTLLTRGAIDLQANHLYALQLTLSGSTLRAALSQDGTTFTALGSASDTRYASGRIGLRTWGGLTAAFSNVAVTAPATAAITSPVVLATAAPVPIAPTLPLEPATPASQFVDSIGINTHISTYLTDTHNVAPIATALQTLGVHHLRDGINTGWADWTNAVNSVLDATSGDLLGIGDCPSPLGSNPTDVSQLNSLQSSLKNRLVTLEFPNEPDLRGDANWVTDTRACIANVRSSVANVRIIAPALGNSSSYYALGNVDSLVDVANTHRYFSGRNPGTPGWGGTDSCGTYGALNWQLCLARIESSKAIMITESGWGDGAGGDVDTVTQGKYASRLWLENLPYANRTYWYGAVDYANGDQFGSYGLLTTSLTPKPAYVALQHEIAYATDGGVPSSTGLRLSFEAPGDVHRRLLAKSNGSYQLAVWQEVQSINPDTKVDKIPASEPVTLSLATPMTATAHVFQNDGTVKDIALGRNTTFTVTALDRMTFVELDP